MQKAHYVPGTNCWIPHPEKAYIEATVVESKNGKVKVKTKDGPVANAFDAAVLLPKGPAQKLVANMDELQELHVASVLQNVEKVFGQVPAKTPGSGFSAIYTCVGPVLIAMNPFAELPVYGKAWIEAYHTAADNEARQNQLGPHCYRTVQEAYSALTRNRNQSIVICGESGAGKTVTNRKMIEYLCEVSKPKSKDTSHVDPGAIANANVMLEAFGNAKTTRNDNSSRFGKYTKLSFLPNEGFTITGCYVDHYLLERSRVVGHHPAERSYHIFYHLLASKDAGKYQLSDTNIQSYTYTKDSAKVQDLDDAKEYESLKKEMLGSGFDSETIENIMKCVAALLHLGNVNFSGNRDKCSLDSKSKASFDTACKLLGLDAAKFSKALVTKIIVVQKKEIEGDLGIDEAAAQRDTVAKTLYSRMFDMIVAFIGNSLNKSGLGGMNDKKSQVAKIGLLDIFGFEDMPINGFEQMFINLTNERMQHTFNRVMFERELEAYKKEGVKVTFTAGTGNIDTVKMFTQKSGPPGIVKLLSESAFMKGGGRDGDAFVSVLNNTFGKHPSFKIADPQDAARVTKAKGLKSKGGKGSAALDYRECFQVKHYAGLIMYTVQQWVPKSIDALQKNLATVLAGSSNKYVAELFDREDAMAKGTVGEKFAQQLEVLGAELEAGETLFVRCIKSNPQMVPNLVNRKLVLEQLVNGGVIAALEIRHKGMPDRMEFAPFMAEYAGLATRKHSKKDFKTQAQYLLQCVFGKDGEKNGEYACGHTKVFMKSHVAGLLRGCAALRARNIVKRVQRKWRQFMGTEKIRRVRDAWATYQRCLEEAKAGGFENLPIVADALFNGMTKIDLLVRQLDKLEQEHGKKNHMVIAKKLDAAKVRELYSITKQCEGAVAFATKGRAEAEQLLATRVNNAISQVTEDLAKVKTAWAGCEELGDKVPPDDKVKFKKAADEAIDFLTKLQKTELPRIKKQGITIQVIENWNGKIPETEAAISPEVNKLMEKEKTLVDTVMALDHEIAQVRVRFKMEVEAHTKIYEESVETLRGLQEDSVRFVAEGMREVADQVRDAWNLQAVALETFEAAKDPDKYKADVEAFAKSVKDTQDLFAEKEAELERREAEKQERKELQASLDVLTTKVDACKADVTKNLQKTDVVDPQVVEFQATLDGLNEEIAGMGYSQEPIEDVRAQVAKIHEDVKSNIATIQKAMAQAKKDRNKDFDSRFSKFSGVSRTESFTAEEGPEEIVEKVGMGKDMDDLMQMHEIFVEMEDSGVNRAQLQRCLNHFVRMHYGTKGNPPAGKNLGDASQSSPTSQSRGSGRAASPSATKTAAKPAGSSPRGAPAAPPKPTSSPRASAAASSPRPSAKKLAAKK